MQKFLITILLISCFIHLDGQVKKKGTYVDDLYYPNISKDSLADRNNLDGLTIDQLNLYQKKAVNMRNAGTVLTFLGGVAAIGGLYLGMKESFSFSALTFFGQKPDESKLYFYTVLLGVGCATSIAGIPLWIAGSKRKYNADIAIMRLNTKPNNKAAVGLGLTMRF